MYLEALSGCMDYIHSCLRILMFLDIHSVGVACGTVSSGCNEKMIEAGTLTGRGGINCSVVEPSVLRCDR